MLEITTRLHGIIVAANERLLLGSLQNLTHLKTKLYLRIYRFILIYEHEDLPTITYFTT